MIWLQLSSGRGPAECEIAVQRLVGIVCDEAEAAGLIASILDVRESQHGLLSATIALDGETAQAFAATWNGTIQWACPSPLRGKASRRNWFVSSEIIAQPEAGIAFAERDLKVETFRASGPGGQHVAKTNSAVRVTHLPTGLTTQAQEERSQARNRALAIARLALLLEQKKQAEQQQVSADKWRAHDNLVRGNPVRVYKGSEFRLKE
jgi:peptide chain release factor